MAFRGIIVDLKYEITTKSNQILRMVILNAIKKFSKILCSPYFEWCIRENIPGDQARF